MFNSTNAGSLGRLGILNRESLRGWRHWMGWGDYVLGVCEDHSERRWVRLKMMEV